MNKDTITYIAGVLPDTPDYLIWSKDGEEILCATEQHATAIADLIDAIYGGPVAVTGYYDPEEDKRFGTEDDRTGFWYVAIE